MSLTPLAPAQQSSVQDLVTKGRLRTVPADARAAANFLGIADVRLGELGSITSPVVRYSVAYDAAHDVGSAFLAAHGYSPGGGMGQHVVIGDFLEIVLDAPPGDARAASVFDQARRARNNQNYRGVTVGAKEAEAIVAIAHTLRNAASTRGVGT